MEEGSSPPDSLHTTQTDNSHLEDQLKSMVTSECMRASTDGEFSKLPADQRAHVLLKIATTSEASEELRCFSLDRLSALLTEVINTWSSEKLAPFNDVVIKSLLSETNDSIKEKMGEILIKVALQSYYLTSDIQVYKSITDFVRNSVRNETRSLKKVALGLVERIPNLFGAAHISDLKDVLERAFSDADLAIKIAAAKTFFSVVGKDTITVLSPLLSYIVPICNEFVTGETTSSSFFPIGLLYKMAFEHTNRLRPHLTAVIHLYGKVTPDTDAGMRQSLTGILAILLKDRNNADIEKDSCVIISSFIFKCALDPWTFKTASLRVISAIPRAFDDAATAQVFVAGRMIARYKLVVIQALNTLVRLLNAHSGKYQSTFLGPLLPKILQKCKVQMESDEEFYSPNYNAITCIWQISGINPNLLSSHFFEVIALSTKIFRKTSTEDGKPFTDLMRTKRSKAFDILTRLFYAGNSIYPNSDSDRNTIAQMCQELTKYAYSGNAAQTRADILDLVATLAEYLGGPRVIVEDPWSVVNRKIRRPQSDDNLILTLEFIRYTNVFHNCPYEAPPFFSFCFDHTSVLIRILALEVFAAQFLRMTNELNDSQLENSLQKLSKLIPQILSLGKNGGEELIAACYCLFNISSKFNVLLHSHLTKIVTFFCQFLTHLWVNDHTRRRIVKSINRISNMPELYGYIVALVPLILSSSLLTVNQVNENINWESRDHFLEGVLLGGTLDGRVERFENLVFGLKGKGVGQKLLQITNPLLIHVDWKQRYVGAIGLSAIGRVATAETVTEVLNRIKPLLRDKHIRVRSAACFAFVRFFTGCPPNLLDKSHTTVIPALLHALKDTRVPRVTAAAAAALAACCKTFSKPALSDHLSALMYSAVMVIESTYHSLLTTGKTRILAQLISLISSLKDVESSQYVIFFHRSYCAEYYSRLIGPLKTIFAAPNHCPVLDAASLECVSLISLAVGEKKCSSDCTEIMQSLLPRIDSILLLWDGDVYSTFGRMASSMGNSFLPFLHPLMLTIIDAIRASPHQFNDEGHLVRVDMDNTIRRRKKTSCEMAAKLATAVGVAFLPYASELSVLALAHLSMPIYQENRQWPREMIPAVLEYFKTAGDEHAMEKLWSEYWRLIVDAIREGEGGPFIPSINKCVQKLGRITGEQRLLIGELLTIERKNIQSRRQSRERMRNLENAAELEDSLRAGDKSDIEMEEAITSLHNNLMRIV